MRAGQITQGMCTYRVRITQDRSGPHEDVITGALVAVAHDQQGTTLRVEVLKQTVELRVSSGYEVEVLDDNGRAVTA